MKYFKNIELAEMYKVSPNTIGNWIEAVKDKKLNLQIEDNDNRTYILNTPHNHNVLKDLSTKGKKFKNTRSLRTIEPKPEFYTTFTETQIIDIATSLEIHKEIDLKYTYFSSGATWWDNYIKRNIKEGKSYTVNNTIQLLDSNTYFIEALVKKYNKINIIDLGSGNAYPVRNFIDYFQKKNVLNKYIAIDYSSDLLKMAENNVKEWFHNTIPVETRNLDFNYELFKDLLFINTSSNNDSDQYVNIILFLGTTIENQRKYNQSLGIIKNSMGPNDILVLAHRLDSSSSRLAVNFNSNDPAKKASDLEQQIKLVLDLLNINEDMYDVERIYSEEEKSRIIRAVLKSDINIKIKTKSFQKIISLQHQDKVIFFRHRHHTFAEVIGILAEVDFNVLHATTSQVNEEIMVISKLNIA